MRVIANNSRVFEKVAWIVLNVRQSVQHPMTAVAERGATNLLQTFTNVEPPLLHTLYIYMSIWHVIIIIIMVIIISVMCNKF